MLIVGYNVNIRCQGTGLGGEILEKSPGTYSDRARGRGFEQHFDTFQRESDFDQGAIRDLIASYSSMEETSSSLFSFGACSSRKHAQACGPQPKLQRVFPFSTGMFAKSLTHSRGLVIVAVILDRRKGKMFSF